MTQETHIKRRYFRINAKDYFANDEFLRANGFSSGKLNHARYAQITKLTNRKANSVSVNMYYPYVETRQGPQAFWEGDYILVVSKKDSDDNWTHSAVVLTPGFVRLSGILDTDKGQFSNIADEEGFVHTPSSTESEDDTSEEQKEQKAYDTSAQTEEQETPKKKGKTKKNAKK